MKVTEVKPFSEDNPCNCGATEPHAPNEKCTQPMTTPKDQATMTLEKQFTKILTEHAPGWNAYPIKALTKAANSQTRSALELLKKRVRGEGEPGNAGEMIAVNEVDDIIEAELSNLNKNQEE